MKNEWKNSDQIDTKKFQSWETNQYISSELVDSDSSRSVPGSDYWICEMAKKTTSARGGGHLFTLLTGFYWLVM